MKILLLGLLLCTQVYAQSTVSFPVGGPSNTSQTSIFTFDLKRFASRLKMNYFNFATGPNMKKWDDNETLDNGNKDLVPVAMYHSINIRYNLIGGLDYFMVPRMATPMGDNSNLKRNMDDNSVKADDWDFGFYYTFIGGHTFNYAHAATYRVPYGNKSRLELVDHFYVYQQIINWAISPAWRFLHWTQYTYYDFREESQIVRHRLLFRNLLNYSFNDHWLVQFGYELDIQRLNTKDDESAKYRDFNFFKRYHSYTTVGLGYNPTPNWTFLPYVRTLDERNIRPETTVMGFMVMGKII